MPGEFGIAGIAASPSGNSLWFTENDSSNVGEISVNGVVGDIFDTGDYPFGITTGPDGNMWYCVGFGNAIGRVNLGRRLLHLRLRLRHRRLRLRLHLRLRLRHLRRLRRLRLRLHHLRLRHLRRRLLRRRGASSRG